VDDLSAVKTLIDTLQPFDKADQERIVRWALEKLGLSTGVTVQNNPQTSSLPQAHSQPTGSLARNGSVDIKTFVNAKNPTSDNQLAATVAYYYAFEAPAELQKEAITSLDLQDACRQCARPRLGDPGKTLRNAHDMGYLDKAGDRGAFKISTVGENLVAVALPGGAGEGSTRGLRKSARKKALVKAVRGAIKKPRKAASSKKR
jgi:hypothetical protein